MGSASRRKGSLSLHCSCSMTAEWSAKPYPPCPCPCPCPCSTATKWLGNFLRTSGGGVVLVSHDEALLGQVCDRIVEVRQAGGLRHGRPEVGGGGGGAAWCWSATTRHC